MNHKSALEALKESSAKHRPEMRTYRRLLQHRSKSEALKRKSAPIHDEPDYKSRHEI